ncbi:MAG: choice-of-anchor B family protein [Balneola sp.]
MQYSHQGWLTEDHSYFIMNDELDEANLGRETKTYIWNIEDLENPQFVGHYTHSTSSIDHNLYIKDGIIYQSNYTSGLQVLKMENLANAELSRIAYFDTKPGTGSVSQGSGGFSGAWSSYPFFESGIIVVSDIEDGLFVLKPDF